MLKLPHFGHNNESSFRSETPNICSSIRRYLQQERNEEYIQSDTRSRCPVDDDDIYTDACLTDRATIVEETEQESLVQKTPEKSVIFRIPLSLETHIMKDTIRITVSNFTEDNSKSDTDYIVETVCSGNKSDAITFCLSKKDRRTDVVLGNGDGSELIQTVEKSRTYPQSRLNIDLFLKNSEKICPYELYSVYIHCLHHSAHLIFMDIDCIHHKNPEYQYTALEWLETVMVDQARRENIRRTLVFSRDYLFRNISGEVSYSTKLEEVLDIFSTPLKTHNKCNILWLTSLVEPDISSNERVVYQFLQFTGCNVYDGLSICQLVWAKKDDKCTSSEAEKWDVIVNSQLAGRISLIVCEEREPSNTTVVLEPDACRIVCENRLKN